MNWVAGFFLLLLILAAIFSTIMYTFYLLFGPVSDGQVNGRFDDRSDDKYNGLNRWFYERARERAVRAKRTIEERNTFHAPR